MNNIKIDRDFIRNPELKMTAKGWRHQVVHDGVVYAVDFVPYGRGHYANVRMTYQQGIWAQRTWKSATKQVHLPHRNTIAKFYVEENGKCRAVINRKENSSRAEKGNDYTGWATFALKIMERCKGVIQ
jgi:hypothetical protein